MIKCNVSPYETNFMNIMFLNIDDETVFIWLKKVLFSIIIHI